MPYLEENDSQLGPIIWDQVRWRSKEGHVVIWTGPRPLTEPQKREALLLHEIGFIPHQMSYRGMPRNRPLWFLCEIGLATFGNGPVGSWLKTNGFMPVWSDPIC